MGAVTGLRWSLAARASFSSLSALVTGGVNVMGRIRWVAVNGPAGPVGIVSEGAKRAGRPHYAAPRGSPRVASSSEQRARARELLGLEPGEQRVDGTERSAVRAERPREPRRHLAPRRCTARRGNRR